MKFLPRIEIVVFLFWVAIFAGWLIRLFPLHQEWSGLQWIGPGGALIGAGVLLVLFVLGKFAAAIRKQTLRRKLEEICRNRQETAAARTFHFPWNRRGPRQAPLFRRKQKTLR